MAKKKEENTSLLVFTAAYEGKIKELETTCNKYTEMIKRLSEELVIREEKVRHLESLLIQTNPLVINISSEEEICELQIERLRQAALSRDLTLEEAKRLDIFVKNKRLAQDQSTINVDGKRLEISDAQLLQIAESPSEPAGRSKP